MPIHRHLTATQLHPPHFREYADSTARLADTDFLIEDHLKMVLQLNDFSFWLLNIIDIDTDDFEWIELFLTE